MKHSSKTVLCGFYPNTAKVAESKKAEFYSWAHTIAMLRDNNTADYDELYHTAFNELREQLKAAGIK
ncbi:hypothetical protein LAW74_24895, partial [Escherichia coli]|nr:hypothetical protein [Escherichia coli]